MIATIYFYAQSLDNQSRDDIYTAKIDEELSYCEDSSQRQKVPLLMSQIVEFSKKYTCEYQGLKGYIQFKKDKWANILIEFGTNQKDELGRNSHNVLVLENVELCLQKSSYEEIVKYYELEKYINSFLSKTNRGFFIGSFYNIGEILNKIKLKKKIVLVIKLVAYGIIVLSMGLGVIYISR